MQIWGSSGNFRKARLHFGAWGSLENCVCLFLSTLKGRHSNFGVSDGWNSKMPDFVSSFLFVVWCFLNNQKRYSNTTTVCRWDFHWERKVALGKGTELSLGVFKRLVHVFPLLVYTVDHEKSKASPRLMYPQGALCCSACFVLLIFGLQGISKECLLWWCQQWSGRKCASLCAARSI